ncbi:MAG: methylmalonyl-CoA mutase family protein [Bacteroidales bacterium]|nr:methylmalonyl-CoA mutase family protein [Bacteroidales bacterium]
MENNKLFSEFPPISTEKWEEVINKDLKGADYEKKLVWKTIEGFNVKPYYRAEDLQGLEYLDSNPNQAPFTRGKHADNNVWDIRQDIKADDLAEANKLALEAVERGANALGLCACKADSVEKMQQLLKGINLEECKINFTCSKNLLDTLKIFAEVVKANGYNPEKVYGSANYDMYGHALLFGEYRGGEESCYKEAKELVEFAKANLPHFRVLTINGRHIHNAGSNIVQELGFTLAAANDLMAHLTDMGVKVGDVATSLVFNFATGSNYFMEIAKIRAARLLWSKIIEQYNPCCDCCYKVYINATSSIWNKSVFDPYVNMLRTTTETMSAAIAGADSITTNPFDVAYKDADSFGYRIGRNQQLLLKEESYMDKIVDPAAGSYYIENLTNSIAQYAWEQFLAVEAKGGFAKAIREGYVQDEVAQMAQRRDMDIATRKTTILGTNQYPNLLEKMGDKIEKENAYGCGCKDKCCNGKATEIKTLRLYRGAEAFEQLRLDTEKSGRRPKVFLLTYGNLAMRKARSGFATNFFGVAGYEIIDNAGFKSAEEGVKAALEAKADVVVLCSSDDEYAEITEQACKGLKGNVKSIVLAGFPKEMVDTYKGYGVDEFIHVKTNVLDCLTKFQKLLGIE